MERLNLTETEFRLICEACHPNALMRAIANADFIDLLVNRLLHKSAALACKVAQLTDAQTDVLRQRINRGR
jgi:hypothetical protein